MHILLTDVVTCPRCGPEFGLIVLADRIEERQVIAGSLGCPNCREQYRIDGGVADLRWNPDGGEPPSSAGGPTGAAAAGSERSYRLAALLGVTGPAGPVVIASPDVSLVREVQGHLPDAGVVGVSGEAPPEVDAGGMGWLLSAGALPFRSRSLGGVVLASEDPLPMVAEALRCLGRGARIVIDPAPPGISEQLLQHGGEVLLEQEGVAVAFDPRAG